MTHTTQRAAILKALLKGKSLTALSAFNLCGTMRLSAIIFFHKKTYPITSERVTKKGKTFAKYSLK